MCGVAFRCYPADIRKGGGLCCSVLCRNRRMALRKYGTLIERFWRRVRKTKTCWLWTGPKIRNGYGQLGDGDGGYVKAHRYSWEFRYGPIPDGMFVLHTCDNPSCVRPDHLFLGTAADNNEDARLKGRLAHSERNGNAKLTAAIVTAMRAEYAAGGVFVRELAEKYNVSSSTADHAIRRITWQYVP